MVTVADTGVGLGDAWTNSAFADTHLGLANVRERIAAAYGGAAALEVGARPGGGVIVSLRIPQERK